jgi:transcriptional regulator GlxA family with amidase domain
MITKRIGVVGFDRVTALDLVGPLEAFAAAATTEGNGNRQCCYEVVVLGLTGRSFVAESGIAFTPHHTLQSAPAVDTLIIPGGSGLRERQTNDRICSWVKRHAHQIRRIASVCTGIYGLAPTGLLDGRRVTTHWRFADDVTARFPALKLDRNALFIRDGAFYTSAGITAGIDLALALIEEDHGVQIALSVARELVVYLKRPGGQEQYSEPLQFQVQSSDRLADLIPWISSHLRQDLSVEILAARDNLCVRHFSRRFRKVFGLPPAEFVQNVRLDEARQRLSSRNNSVRMIADSVGFTSADSFRRAFERRFGISPTAYRGRFEALRRGRIKQIQRAQTRESR